MNEKTNPVTSEHEELTWYTHAYCNCCGETWKLTDEWPIVCPNCMAEYDEDRPDIIELYRDTLHAE